MATGTPDAAGLAACIAARAGLEQLSRERVRMELLKLLLARHATPALAVMAESGLLVPVLGGVADLAGFENMAKVEAAAGVQADAVQRLGALGVRVAEDAERLWQRLRLSNAEHERLASMARGVVADVARRRQGRPARCSIGSGRSAFVDRVLLAWARSPATRARYGLARAGGAAGALGRAGVSAQGRRFHQARRGAGARRSARLCMRPRRPGSRPIFRRTARRSRPLPTPRRPMSGRCSGL